MRLADAELANLRVAHQHLLKVAAWSDAAELVGGLGEVAAFRMIFEVLTWFDRAQASRPEGTPPPSNEVDHYPLIALFQTGRLDDTCVLAERVLADPSARPDSVVLAHVGLAWSHANQGRTDDVLDHLDTAIGISRGLDNPYWAILAL